MAIKEKTTEEKKIVREKSLVLFLQMELWEKKNYISKPSLYIKQLRQTKQIKAGKRVDIDIFYVIKYASIKCGCLQNATEIFIFFCSLL